MTLPKIAFVVQRYGEDVVGGAETLCRQVAEHLSDKFNIDVITTCAKDYHTWANFYHAGVVIENSVRVVRFPVDYERRWYFAHLNRLVHRGIPLPTWLEEMWMRAQGPYSSALLDYILKNRQDYCLFVFFTYLYCTTYFGLPLVKESAILVPTAHDEPPLRLKIFRKMFSLPKGFIFLKEEEKDLVCRNFPLSGQKFIIAGAGVEIPEKVEAELPADIRGVPYLLYLGRVDPGKNTAELLDYFLRYRQEHPDKPLKLVLAGHCAGILPRHEDIIYLGFVSEEEKFALLKGALALVQPSAYESLSLVVLEAMACGTPVLVNAKSAVLIGHCQKSGAGWWYKDCREFAKAVSFFFEEGRQRAAMGQNGRRYVQNYYSWQSVTACWVTFIDELKIRVPLTVNPGGISCGEK